MADIDYAYTYYSEAFNRHFTSLDEAKHIEACARAGDDKAMVRLWLLYQDGKYEEMKYRPPSQYIENIWSYQGYKKINENLAHDFRLEAKESYNKDALDFPTSVKFGNRQSEANYPIYIEYVSKNDGVYSSPFLPDVHQRYKEDIWWESLHKAIRNEECRTFFLGTAYNSVGAREKFTYFDYCNDAQPSEFAGFLRKELGKTIPALEICAQSGDRKAAIELESLYSRREWQYKEFPWRQTTKAIQNPFYDLGKANHWQKVSRFLYGKGEEQLLDSFMLSQDKTSEGLYNIGVALFTNAHVRALYNKRLDRVKDDLTAAYDFLKNASNLGYANAGWFLGDRFQDEAERENNPEKIRQAIFWYSKALDHPNAKRRYKYLSNRNIELSLAKLTAEEVRAVNPSKGHMQQYPHSVGHIEVMDVDYSFLFDDAQGGLLERMHRAQKLSDSQVAEFGNVISALEAKITAMLSEADVKTGRASAINQQRENAFANNTQTTRAIGSQERQITAEKARWRKEQIFRIVAGSVITYLTGGMDIVVGTTAHTLMQKMGAWGKNSSTPLVAGSKANSVSAIELRELAIADLTAQLSDIGLLDEQQVVLRKEIERLGKTSAMAALQQDATNVQRLFQGYLRQQILEMGVQDCEYVNKYAGKAGINSIDGFLKAFEDNGQASADKQRIYKAIWNFCVGAADTHDLHLMLAYSDALGKKAKAGEELARHEQALLNLVEKHVKPSIDDYASKSSRMDVLKEFRFTLAPPKGDALAVADEQHNAELGALMKFNFASEGSLEINRIFDFYLHRHGSDNLRPTRLNDGLVTDVSEKKRVTAWTSDQQGEFIDRAIHSYKHSRVDLPHVENIFLRICAAEYFEPQSVITSGKKGNFKDNPQAPVAYPMVNDVINEFVSQMQLSPMGKYRSNMENKQELDALIAQSFIDFFAVLGQTHTTKFAKEREDLARAYDLKSYGTRFRDCYHTIADDACEQYSIFKDIFAHNLQKTLETKTAEISAKLLKDLEEIKQLGAKGLDPEGIVIPGTPEDLERSLRKDRRFENMRPPFISKS